MRVSQQIMDVLLSFAEHDARIRVVTMGGSRVNAKVREDALQDYDIAFLVTDMESFTRDDGWLDRFGKRLIMQKPEAMSLFPPELGGWFTYLMLFEDGNRIDLMLVPLSDLPKFLAHDSLLSILADKDGRVPIPPAADDSSHHVRSPSPAFFDDCCNEFWWVSTYVAKGLCRGEFLYAAEHLEQYVRPGLLRMLSWQAGTENGFSINAGKAYKYLENYIKPDVWNRLLSTYSNGTLTDIRRSLFSCQALFRESSGLVAERLGLPYPDYDANVTRYLDDLLGIKKTISAHCGEEQIPGSR